ncbi:MAG TPA: hypothetical protein VE422_25890 [Terriglobia bacterium]|nr:hypothetical protein [Terriglobia bacterium]
MKKRLLIFCFVLWAGTCEAQSSEGLICKGSQAAPTLTKTLWNGFVVAVTRVPGAVPELACTAELRDPAGRTVFGDSGYTAGLDESGVDVDNDGKPDVVLVVDSGGGNLGFWEYTIISFSSRPRIVATLSGPILHFERDSDGKTVIRNTEVFYGLTSTNADAPAIDAYRQFRSGRLVDVTADHCKSIPSKPTDSDLSRVLQNLYCGQVDLALQQIREKWPVPEQARLRSQIKSDMELRRPDIARRMTNWN